MAKVAKTASKNNPTQRNKGAAQKMFQGKAVKPVKFIDRDNGLSYMAAQWDNGNVIEDSEGNPIKWEAV